MKYFNKLMVFFLFMLFGYGVDTFAPTYTIFNMTGKNIEVKPYFFSETTGKGGIGEAQLIRSNDTYRFSEPDTCLTKIHRLPIKAVDRNLFNNAKTALEQFNKAEKKQEKEDYEKKLEKSIAELKDHVKDSDTLITLGFCEDREFIIIEMESKGRITNQVLIHRPQ